MKNKRIAAFLISVLLILLLFVSCTPQDSVNDDLVNENSEIVPGEITMSVFDFADGHLRAAAELYEQKTGIKVNIQNDYYAPAVLDSGDVNFDTSIYTEQRLSALMAGKGADIYDVRWLDFQQLGENGLLVDMNSWLDSDDRFSDEVMFRDILLSGKTQDNVFAIPVDFYFLRMFASSEDESFPENKRMTWTEFFDQVSENGYTQDVAYLYTDLEVFMERFTSRASEFIDESGNTQALNSPEMIALLEECMAWKESGLCSDSGDPAYMERSYSYIGFPVDHMRIADALCSLPDEYSGSGDHYGYFVSPIPFDGETVSQDGAIKYPAVNDITYYGVNAGSPNAEEAQKFLQFLLSEEAQDAMLSVENQYNGFDIPLNRDSFRKLVESDIDIRILRSHPGLKLDVQTLVKEAESVIDEISYIIPEKPYYQSIIKDTAAQYFNGNISAEEAAKQMANKVDLYLKEQK